MLHAAFTHVVVGSTNPVKVAAVRTVVARIAPHATVEGVAAHSTVPDQPWGDDETIRGARARANHALTLVPHATLAVGIEGGVVSLDDGTIRSCAWAVVRDRSRREGVGGSLAMPLPAVVATRLQQGEELAHAMDAAARTTGTKHGVGAVGILTAGLIDRQRAYEPLVTFALAPWLAPTLFDASAP